MVAGNKTLIDPSDKTDWMHKDWGVEKMKKKLLSLSVAFVVLLNIVVSVPFLSLMAAEPVLELGASIAQAGVKPGQIVDVTVDLGNYGDDNVPGLSGLA